MTIRHNLIGIWLGGEPLDMGKGLYPRIENRSISTPNIVSELIIVLII